MVIHGIGAYLSNVVEKELFLVCDIAVSLRYKRAIAEEKGEVFVEQVLVISFQNCRNSKVDVTVMEERFVFYLINQRFGSIW